MGIKSKPADGSQPFLGELLGKYLSKQVTALKSGLAVQPRLSEVEPYDAVASQPIDARLAWSEAREVLAYLAPKVNVKSWKAPPDWPNLVANQTETGLISFCLGNFPQQVRQFGDLIQQDALEPWSKASATPLSPRLQAWVESAGWKMGQANPLMSAAIYRLSGNPKAALQILDEAQTKIPKAWQPVWANEYAATLWHSKDTKKAQKLWKQQESTAPVSFNLGIADLVDSNLAGARAHLQRAIANLPESRSWHHLAAFYLALCDLR